jgi:hypothetical protein
MTTMRAVVRYPVEATDAEKIRELKGGLQDVVGELAELGLDMEEIREELEGAESYAEFIWDEIRCRNGGDEDE